MQQPQVKAKKINWQSKAYPITGGVAQNITIPSADLPSDKLVRLHFVYTGSNQFSHLTRIRVNANSDQIVNCTASELQAYYEAYARSNFNLANAALRWTLAFDMLDMPTWEEGFLSQFPRKSACEVILSVSASAGAGNLYVGWTETNITPRVHPSLLSSAMNIAASQAKQKYNFQSAGIVRGISTNTVGVQQSKIVVSGEPVKETSGAKLLATTTGDMFIEAEALDGVGVNFTDPIFHKITLGKQAPLNSSYIELETHSTWGGVTNEACIYSLHPNILPEDMQARAA